MEDAIERVRGLEDRLRVLSEAAHEFAEATADYERLIDLVARRLAATVKDACVVHLLSDDGWLSAAAIHLPIKEVIPDQATRARIGEHIAARHHRTELATADRVLTTGEPVLIPHVDLDEIAKTATPEITEVYRVLGIHSILLVPLRVRRASIGVLSLARFTTPGPFAQPDLELAQVLADHAALAIANSHLLRSARVALEQRLRAEALEAENERVNEANRMKSEFLANMSHELRTPLNAILGFSQLLHDEQVGPLVPGQREFLGHVLASGRHLLQLIDDLLDLSRIEAGRLVLEPKPFDPRDVLREVLAIVEGTAAERGISITSHVDEVLGELVLDPGRLRQVLLNYLSNALKFTGAGGSVCVRVACEGDGRVRVEVQDNGIGIAEADRARLFVPFEQLDRKHGGTGLGLALTRRLVEQQGGSVGVVSVVGEGSTFHAILPRRAEP